jgi:hypothetical protein
MENSRLYNARMSNLLTRSASVIRGTFAKGRVVLPLVLATTVAVSMSGVFILPQTADAGVCATIFSDGFESATEFIKWAEHTGNWDVTSGSGHSGSKKAQVADTGSVNDILRLATSTMGYQNIQFSYWYRISEAIESGDHIYVEYSTGTGWTQLANYSNLGGGGWNSATFNLPASASNKGDFQVRFVGHLDSDHDEFQLDDVNLCGAPVPVNHAPVLDSIGNKSVNEGVALSFTINATDADGNPLAYSASNLPSGASFSTSTRTFSWTPGYAQSGSYPGVHFAVTDGSATDTEDITITVNDMLENTAELCSDQIDNDGDQLVDLADPDCVAFVPQGPLFPTYGGDGACPQGTEPVKQGTYTIQSTDPDGESFSLVQGRDYLFSASQTFSPSFYWGSGGRADAGYTTTDGWNTLATQYGIHGTGSDLGAHALLADLGSGVGILDWGAYNADHVYQRHVVASSSNVQFVIGDRWSTWFGTQWDNQGAMFDNSGSLLLDVYECQRPQQTVYQCSDGIDNDEDRLTDYPADPGCTSAQDDDESNTPEVMCSTTIVSDTSDYVVEAQANAVATWNEHTAWTASIPGATWIWKTFLVENPTQDETYTFRKSFNWNGGISNATFTIASDNTFAALLNSTSIGSGAGFASGDEDAFDVTANIQQGTNTLEIQTTNLAYQGSSYDNPAGLLYRLDVTGQCGEQPTYQCNDGIDNDQDGSIDMQDPGCTSSSDDSESDSNECTPSTVVLDAVPQGSLSTWTVNDTGGNPIFSYSEISSPYDDTTAIRTSVVGDTYQYCPSQTIDKTYVVSGNTDASDLMAYLAFTSTMDEYNFPYVLVYLYDSQDNPLGYQYYYGNGVISGIYAGYAAADPAHYTQLPVAAGDVMLDLSRIGSNINFSKVKVILSNYACVGQNSVTFDHLRLVNQCGSVAPAIVVAPPIADPDSGWYHEPQNVTLLGEEGTTIRYSIGDGSNLPPTCSTGELYDGAIHVTQDSSIRAIACLGDTDSTVANFHYRIGPRHTGGGSFFPEVLGESTSEPGGGATFPTSTASSTVEVLGESTSTGPSCGEYLNSYLWFGKKNDGREVTKLQQFLNDHEGNALPITGYFGALTRNAVKNFQMKYSTDILSPWDALPKYKYADLGNVYKTTKRQINMLMCSALNLPIPELP